MRHLIILALLLVSLMSFKEELDARGIKKRSPRKGHPIVSYRSDGYLMLNNSADVGFGALVFSILTVLDEFEKGNMSGVKINFDSGCYLDPDLGPNWWEYFFEPIALGDDKAPPFYLTKKQVLLTINNGYRISRQRSSELTKKYIILKPHMQQEIDSYIEQHFQGNYVIGVHHRGTDKKTENPLIPFERTLQTLSDVVTALPESDRNRLRIYVATDEEAFLERVAQLYPSHVVYNDFVRSINGQPLHYSQHLYGSNYQKGKEAVIDCLLLSQCNLLIYPASSSYSLLSTALNDELKTVPLYWTK